MLRRSSDGGQTWGPLIEVVLSKVGPKVSNPNPVEVDGGKFILLNFDSKNNPEPVDHGFDYQMKSTDDGLSACS